MVDRRDFARCDRRVCERPRYPSGAGNSDGGGEVVVPAPLAQIPVWVRAGAIVLTYPAAHAARGLGDTSASQRPLEATLWGSPSDRSHRASARLADGLRISWGGQSGREAL